jgi:hypothetical protein
VRIAALFFLAFVGDALAANEGSRGPSRLDFANTPAFQSVFDNRVPWTGTANTTEARSEPRISAKLRIAMWASQSAPPYRAEVLRALRPSVIPIVPIQEIAPVGAPTDTVTARTMRSAGLEGSSRTPHVLRAKRSNRPPPDIEYEEEPSFLGMIFGALLPGE